MAAELTLAGREPAVRRHQGARRSVSFAVEPGQIFGLVGPERRRQDLAVQLHQRALQADRRHRPDRRAPRCRARARRRSPGTAWPGRSSTRRCSCDATVLENVLLGAHTRLPGGAARVVAAPAAHPARRRSELRAEALDLLERNGLGWAARPAGRRAVARPAQGRRALPGAAHEAAAAAARRARRRPPARARWSTLIATVRRLRAEDDITVVIVEHHMGLIAALTDRVVVLDHGSEADGGHGRRGAVRRPRHRGLHRKGRRG